MDDGLVRIICAVLAVLLLGLIVLRRRNKAEE
jgi:MYXO-CTERM domain-containing protein